MNTVNNSRSRETKEKLKEALLHLLSSGKTADTVSVKEICTECGINRSTFYAHYAVPGDIIQEIESTTLQQTSRYIFSMSGNEKENTTLLLSYMKRNQETFRILFSATAGTGFSEKLIFQIFPIFSHIEAEPFPKHLFSYIKTYTIDGARAVILSWMKEGCVEPEEQIADLLIILSKRVIDTAFTYGK